MRAKKNQYTNKNPWQALTIRPYMKTCGLPVKFRPRAPAILAYDIVLYFIKSMLKNVSTPSRTPLLKMDKMTTWLTEREAAFYLKVPEDSLKNARYRKKITSRKFCGVVQYKQEWLDAFREGKNE
jgi:hypothetical protein